MGSIRWMKQFGQFRAHVAALGVVVCCTVFSFPASAQTFAEWFRQKKTQKKYLLEQVAALQLYAGYVKKGYAFAGEGLDMVRNITSGEFNLHELFITGLKKVSPVVRSDHRVAKFIALQLSIFKAFGGLTGADGFQGEQLAYVLDVKGAVLLDCLSDLEELYLVITSGRAEMGDDERLRRIGALHERMLDKSAFTQDFVASAGLLLNHQRIERARLEQFRRYYE